MFAALPEERESARCFYRLARELEAWAEVAERLENLWELHPDNRWLPYYLGHTNWWRNPERAIESFRAAADGFGLDGEADSEIRARENLRRLLSRLELIAEANREVERVRVVAEASGNPMLVTRALILNGEHLAETGAELERARRLLRRAERAVFPSGPETLKRDCLFFLGHVSFYLGRYSEALKYYKRLKSLADDAEDLDVQAATEYSIVNTLSRQMEQVPQKGGRQRLLLLARKALQAAKVSNHKEVEAMAHRTIGDLLSRDPGKRSQAQFHFEKCLKLARENSIAREVSHCLWALGRFLTDSEPDKARHLIDEALRVAQDLDDPNSLAYAWRERMRLSWKNRSMEEAVSHSRNALDAIETLRALQLTGGGRTGLFSTKTDDYYFFSGSLLRNSPDPSIENLELAFAVSERMRSRTLLESLEAARARPTESSAEVATKQLHNALLRIASVQRQLLNPHLTQHERVRALESLSSSEVAYEELRGKMARNDASLAEFRRPRFAGLAEIQENLSENEAMLSFQVGLWENTYGRFVGGSWVMVSTRAGTRAFRLPDRVFLKPAVNVFLGLVERRDGSEAKGAERLYDVLLQGAVAALPKEVEHLIIVPDGILHRVPFAALSASQQSAPLGTRYSVTVVPSATLWLRWRRVERPVSAATALVLADPIVVGAPENAEAAEERNWPWLGGKPPASLPHARREGGALKAHLGEQSRLLLGEEAAERFVKDNRLEQFSIIHFAAHAVVDEQFPDRSAILLAPGSAEEDGLLQMREIVGLDLNGQLVVLSNCQSASGAVLGGEGVLSLARGFFQAGAAAVVGSLWPLRDDDAAILISSLYRYLARGMTVSIALQKAQQEARDQGLPAAAWAGLLVIGDGTLIPFPEGAQQPAGGPSRLWPLMGVLLAILLILALRRHFTVRPH